VKAAIVLLEPTSCLATVGDSPCLYSTAALPRLGCVRYSDHSMWKLIAPAGVMARRGLLLYASTERINDKDGAWAFASTGDDHPVTKQLQDGDILLLCLPRRGLGRRDDECRE